MAAPREVPVILGLIVSCASVATHVVRATLERAQRRAAGAPVEPLARTEALSPADIGVVISILIVGAIAVLVVRPPRQPVPQTMWRRRVALVLACWAAFSVPALGMMVRRPLAEWASFLVPCAILVLPARTYARHRRGEAAWAPWIIGLAAVVLGVTRDPKYTWGLLIIALVTHGVALAQARRRTAREATIGPVDAGPSSAD
ncbi:MAG: hypothetical protein QM820_45430 [Minicystis sp.]